MSFRRLIYEMPGIIPGINHDYVDSKLKDKIELADTYYNIYIKKKDTR